MVDRNDSFMREVNDAIRQEQLMKLWERFGIIAIVGLVALFVGIGVYKWKESSRISSEIKAGESYEVASRLASDGKTSDALKAFDDLAKNGPSGYAALARLRLAAAHAKENRVAEAIAAYEALSADSGVDQLLRDFATLQAAVLRLDQADWTEMKNRLTPLVGDQQPWRAEARETLGIAALKSGRAEEATKLFEQLLGDRTTTSGMSRRAQEMLAVLTDRAAAKEAPKEVSPPAKGENEKAAPAADSAKGTGAEPAAKN
jgi:hypothetical protein